MILYAVSTILSLFPLFSLSLSGVMIGLLNTAVLAYIYVVIYSVYDLLQREYEGAFGRQNQEARKALHEIWTKDWCFLTIIVHNKCLEHTPAVCSNFENQNETNILTSSSSLWFCGISFQVFVIRFWWSLWRRWWWMHTILCLVSGKGIFFVVDFHVICIFFCEL